MRGVEFYGLRFVWRRSFEHSAGSLDWKLSSNIWSMHWYTSMLLVIMAVHCLIYLGNHRAWSHPPISSCALRDTSAPPQAFTISKVIYRVSTLQKTKILWKIYHKSQLRHDFPNFFQCLEVYCKRHQGRYRHLAKIGSSPSEPPSRRRGLTPWSCRSWRKPCSTRWCPKPVLWSPLAPRWSRWARWCPVGPQRAPSQWPKCGDDRKHRCWDGFLAGARREELRKSNISHLITHLHSKPMR